MFMRGSVGSLILLRPLLVGSDEDNLYIARFISLEFVLCHVTASLVFLDS